MYKFINKSAEYINDKKFDDARDFSQGLAPIKVDGKWGFIKKDGEIAIQPNYENALSFFKIMLSSKNGPSLFCLALVQLNKRWGFIDQKGNLFLDFIYEDAKNFSEIKDDALAPVKMYDRTHGKSAWGYIDLNGKVIIPPKYKRADVFSGGLAAVSFSGSGGEMSYINQNGDINSRLSGFYNALKIEEGIACVEEDGYDFIDSWKFLKIRFPHLEKKGSIIPLNKEKYALAESFSDGYGLVGIRDQGEDIFFGYIDREGKQIIKPQYEDAKSFHEGLAPVRKNRKWGVIDKDNKLVIDFKFDDMDDFSEGIAPIKLSGQNGYVNTSGNHLIIDNAIKVFAFNEGIAKVEF